MTTRIFVGQISFDTSENTLKELFAPYGEVASVAIILDKATNRSKGFAFVEMNDLKGAQRAIKELDGKEVDGKAISVSAARERSPGPRRDAGFRSSW